MDGQKGGRELSPAARGNQDAGSRNLGSTFYYYPWPTNEKHPCKLVLSTLLIWVFLFLFDHPCKRQKRRIPLKMYEHSVLLTLTVIKLCQSRIWGGNYFSLSTTWGMRVCPWQEFLCKVPRVLFHKAKHWPRSINPKVAITGSTLFLPYQRHNVAIREPKRLFIWSHAAFEPGLG